MPSIEPSDQPESRTADLKNASPSFLTEALAAAGLPVLGVASSGRMDFSRKLTQAEVNLLPAIIDAASHRSPTIFDVASDREILTALWTLAASGSVAPLEALKERLK